ncbi:MAG: hypothetical protein K0S65_3943, partial [Labilithrix sp.]|nr:hypothetical protein [Labilithrix sp.]
AAHPVVELASSASGISPSFRLGLAWANSGTQEAPEGKLTLGLRALVFSACGYQFHLAKTTGPGVRLCAVLEGGLLEIRPFALARPTSPDRPWFTVGPLVRVEVPVLSDRLVLAGDAALAIPFEREHVYSRSLATVELVDQLGVRLAATLLAKLF